MLKKSKKQTWDLAKTRENSIFAVALVWADQDKPISYTSFIDDETQILYIFTMVGNMLRVAFYCRTPSSSFNRICFVEQRCAEDGNTNDEHTEHHEKEHEGCSVHQMHQFIVNAKVAKNIQQKIFDGGHH